MIRTEKANMVSICSMQPVLLRPTGGRGADGEKDAFYDLFVEGRLS